MKIKITRIISFSAVIIAITLMAFPTSAYLSFADSPEFRDNPDDRFIVFESYFNFHLIGWAHFFPPLTAYLSVILALLHCMGLSKPKLLHKAIFCLSCVCITSAALVLPLSLRYPFLPSIIIFFLIFSLVIYTVGERRD